MTIDDPNRPGERPPGAPASSTARAERSDHSHWNWLLLIPLLATLYPPLYNRLEPLLFDIPFFYWYQLAAIGLERRRDAHRLQQDEGLTMFDDVNAVELTVFTVLFVFVSVLGFVAARWRRADDLEHLDEWGLGGRNFGSWITWFLIGGDLYTAYTFVAVPALVFGAGAIGFFAVPYTIVVYPIVFLVLIRLWSISPRARLRHAGRLRPRPPRLVDARAARRHHRASSRRCPTSRCSWSASRPSSRRWASPATCRSSSRSRSSRPTPTTPGCARPR